MEHIPVIINNRNRLSSTRKLVEDLNRLTYHNVHIIDNASTYAPLLEWYETNPCKIKRLNSNLGQLAIYNSDYINEFNGWVAYTDSDIELNPNTPKGFISKMIDTADRYGYNKIGLALDISNLPNSVYGNNTRNWEQKYWENSLEKNVYVANVDTTFSLIKVGLPFDYQALRIGGDMTAKHVPWYLDYDNLSEEEKYVLDNSSSEFSTTKRFVNSLSLHKSN